MTELCKLLMFIYKCKMRKHAFPHMPQVAYTAGVAAVAAAAVPVKGFSFGGFFLGTLAAAGFAAGFAAGRMGAAGLGLPRLAMISL